MQVDILFTSGDSFKGHNGIRFSTKDQDNDTWSKHYAEQFQGGWWCAACLNSEPYCKSAIKSWSTVNWYTCGTHYTRLRKQN